MPKSRWSIRRSKYLSLDKDHRICTVRGCGYSTPSAVGMRLHMRCKHGIRMTEEGVEEALICGACHMAFGTLNDIGDHYRRSNHHMR